LTLAKTREEEARRLTAFLENLESLSGTFLIKPCFNYKVR
jgi:hypothetical protein